MRSSPFGDSARSLTASSASASSLSKMPQRCRNSWPASVSQSRRVLCSISRAASRSSSAMRWRRRWTFPALRQPWRGCSIPPSWQTPHVAGVDPFFLFSEKRLPIFGVYFRFPQVIRRDNNLGLIPHVTANRAYRDVDAARGKPGGNGGGPSQR